MAMTAVRASGARRRTVLAVVTLAVLVVAANLLVHEIAAALQFDIRPSNEDRVHQALMTSAAAYSLLIAIPFVPAVEIALALIAAFGPAVVLLVYACTLAGLAASFLAGRLIPLQVLARLFEELGLRRAGALLARLAPLPSNERIRLLADAAPGRLVPFLLRHRYLALAVAINIPGNVIIGGGGGIALTAGVSRVYSVTGFLATIVLAVAPVPLAVLVFGKEVLSG